MKKSFIILSIFLLFFVSKNQVHASIVSARSCGSSDVQVAVNAAADGDTILIPAGSCTWTTKVVMNGSSRSLNVQGGGKDSTIINLSVAGDADLTINLGVGKLFQMSNVQFTGGSNNYPIFIGGSGGSQFLIHDLKFNTSIGSSNEIFRVSGETYGVFSHLTISGPVRGVVNIVGGGCKSWDTNLTAGTSSAVYLEDSTLSFTGHNEGVPVFDSQGGGKYVLRYNNITNATLGQHGADSGECGGLISEIYNNTFTYTNYTGQSTGCTWNIHGGGMRAGEIIIHNNKWNVDNYCQIGTWSQAGNIGLSVYRDPAGPNYFPAWKYPCAVGNQLKFCSQLNQDWTGAMTDCKNDGDCGAGTCKWKLCSGSQKLCTVDGECPGGQTCNRYVDGGSGNGGYPCFEQCGYGAGNLPKPAYEWNNTFTGAANKNGCGTAGCGNVGFSGSNFVQPGRDFYNDTQKPGYSPYTYPHPLTTGKIGTTGTSGEKYPIYPGIINIK